MKQIIVALFSAFLVVLLLNACADPTGIGADLLEEDQVDVEFTDTLSLKSKIERSDSVRTYSPFLSSQLNSYLFGNFKDPVFGNTLASNYLQLRLEFDKVDFTNSVLDSIILVIPYDTTGIYGDISETFGMDILQVVEEMPRLDEHFSNTTFETDMLPLMNYEFTPTLDSIPFISYVNSTPDTISFPHLRIPIMMTDPIKEIFFNQDTNYYENDTTFFSNSGFHGLHLNPTLETAGLLSFELGLTGSGIYVYYVKDDTLETQFRFELNELSTRTVNYQQDYSGSIVESFLENPDLTDTLAFVQSMAGLNLNIEVPNITDLKGIIVNKAELELNIASIEGDSPDLYGPIEQLLISKRNSEGNLEVISDVVFSGGSTAALNSVFGGIIETGDDGAPDLYKMNLSSHIQDMIDGVEPNTIIITPLSTSERAFRVPLYGASHPEYRIKLKLAYTKL